MAGLFASHALHYEVTIRARFGSTVCALMSCPLGIAIVDDFTLATHVAHRKDIPLSSHGARFVAALRGQMEAAARSRQRKK